MSTLPPPAYTPPPSQMDLHLEQEPPAWPKVIGIISIVWGGLGIPCSLCIAVGTFATSALLEFGARMQAQAANQPGAAGAGGGQQLPTTPFPAELKPNAIQMFASVEGLAAVVILIIAGVALLRRAPKGRGLHLLYAAMSILGTVLAVIGAYMASQSQSGYFAKNPTDEWTVAMQGQMGSTALIQTVVGSLIALIYPVFCLVWFGVIKKNASDMGQPKDTI